MRIIGVIFVLLAWSCSKSSMDPSTTPAPQTAVLGSFDLLQDKVLTPSCATAGCHLSATDPSFAQHGLVLAKGQSYVNLIGVTPKNSVAVTNKMLRVKKFSSAESLLYHKLNWDQQNGEIKPFFCSPISLNFSKSQFF